MNCLFCEKSETAFVELLCFDATDAVSRHTLKRGVCTDHANEAGRFRKPQNNRAADTTTQITLDPYPEHYRAFFEWVECTFEQMFGAPTGNMTYAIRYHALDSVHGADIRARRLGMLDPREARVHNPLKNIPIDRVSPDEYAEAFGLPVFAKGKIFG